MPYTYPELHKARHEEKKERLDRLERLIDSELRYAFRFGDHDLTSDAVIKLEIPNRESATRWEMDEVEGRFRSAGWEYVRIWRPFLTLRVVKAELRWRVPEPDANPYEGF